MKLYYWANKDGQMISETASLYEGNSDAEHYNIRLRCNRNLVKYYLAEWVFDKIDESFIDSFCRMAKSHGFERKELELTPPHKL